MDRRVLQHFFCGWWNCYTAVTRSTRSSLVRAGCTKGGWGWSLGRRGYWLHLPPLATRFYWVLAVNSGFVVDRGTRFRPVRPVSLVRVFRQTLQYISCTYPDDISAVDSTVKTNTPLTSLLSSEWRFVYIFYVHNWETVLCVRMCMYVCICDKKWAVRWSNSVGRLGLAVVMRIQF